jgi:hypothetical protein
VSADEPDVLLFKYVQMPGGGKPVVPLRLTASHQAVVGAALAPSLPQTVISPVWAAAIGLSQGGTVVAQIQTRMALNSDLWGPQEILVPVFATELDEVIEPYAESEDIDWRERDACLLGHDFLRNITAILDGINGRLILDTESPLTA